MLVPVQAQTIRPSFDCKRTGAVAERMICDNPELAEIDRELARVYGLAKQDPQITLMRRDDLVRDERGWIAFRNDCKDMREPESCIGQLMLQRIHQLRESHPVVREEDQKGISLGPFVANCDGSDAGINVTFVNSNPGYAYLESRAGNFAMPNVVSASGARYETVSESRTVSLWSKGDSALITLPGGAEMTCALGQAK